MVIQLTQEDLASMAGTTRATASKVSREWEEQGVVRLGWGAVTVLDRMRLERKARR